MISCSNDGIDLGKYIDPEIEPDVVIENLELLYSDSARLMVKMTAPLAKQFSSVQEEQRKEFPDGLRVWFYEKTGELKAELTANWALHNEVTNIWEARSNVVLIDAEGKKLETEQLFWNPQSGKVYNDTYTKMTTSEDGTFFTGNSFSANQDFTNTELKQSKATIWYYDDETEGDGETGETGESGETGKTGEDEEKGEN
jgi:hypothetical protein